MVCLRIISYRISSVFFCWRAMSERFYAKAPRRQDAKEDKKASRECFSNSGCVDENETQRTGISLSFFVSLNRQCFVFACALTVMLPCTLAVAQGPLSVTLLATDGTQSQFHLAGLSNNQLRVFDDDRRLVERSTDDFALLTLALENESSLAPTLGDDQEPLGRLILTNGQHLAGSFSGSVNEGELLRWLHPHFGFFDIPLEHITGWTVGEAALPTADPMGGDTVVLSSGEQLAGFLYFTVEDNLTTFQLAPAAAPDDPAIAVPATSVAAVLLANLPVASSASAHARVALQDGSRLDTHNLTLGSTTLAFDATVGSRTFRVERPAPEVKRVLFTTHGRSAVDWVDLDRMVVEPHSGDADAKALWGPNTAGATSTAEGWTLSAPATLVLELPPKAQRVVGTMSLNLPPNITPERAAWAGCVLHVDIQSSQGQTDEPWQATFDAQNPTVAFNLAVPDGAVLIRLTLDSGPRGPVLDTLKMEDGLVLVGE